MQSPVKLLHLSDLHLRAKGRRRIPYDETGVPGVSDVLQEDLLRAFLDELDRFLENVPHDERPVGVLVTGDVVDRGGCDGDEFGQARWFLSEVARRVGCRDEAVHVVPGNHDVNWSRGLRQPDRFRNFVEQMGCFTIPTFQYDDPEPRHVRATWSEGVSVDLLLLISPTFSGVPDPQTHLARILDDLVEEEGHEGLLERINEHIREGSRKLDIAAIGTHQRESIATVARESENGDAIRIAMMHHHLLPDPYVEATQFEAVLDSGKVLDVLIRNGFDLMLTGHKHNKRLVHYRCGSQMIDVYSAPSLFDGNPNCPSGFTILNIFGPDSPYYARLDYFKTAGCEPNGDDLLVREGRVIPELQQVCAEISPPSQKARLVPILRPISLSLAWAEDHPAPDLFDRVWSTLEEDFDRLSKQKLLFRPPRLSERWTELIALVHADSDIRLVSENDIDFWLRAKVEGTDAWFYERPLHEFLGRKARALVLRLEELRDEERANRVSEVIDWLQESRFEVLVVSNDDEVADLDKDFGLLGDLAVSRFEVRSATRSLEVSFGPGSVESAMRDWDRLARRAAWNSSSGRDFRSWLATYLGGNGLFVQA